MGGLLTETWKPTWLCFNGVPSSCPGGAAPSGVHAPQILMEVCGYSEADVNDMYDKGLVLPIYWDKSSSDTGTDLWKDAHVWPSMEGKSKRRLDMDPAKFMFQNQVSATMC